MKQFIAVLIIAISLTSCDDSSPISATTAKLMKCNYQSMKGYVVSFDSTVCFKQVTPLVEPGDILDFPDGHYRVISIQRTSTTALARDYQIDVKSEDSLSIYDGNRLVGTIPINWVNPHGIDSLIMADNY